MDDQKSERHRGLCDLNGLPEGVYFVREPDEY